MAEEKDIDQLIEAYLGGSLSQEDTDWLEQRLKVDSGLAELVEGMQLEQRIEAHLQGSTSVEEREAFEKELVENDQLKQAWEDYHIIRGMAKLKRREQYLGWFEQMEEKDKRNDSSRFFRIFRKWTPIIGFLLVFLVSILAWWYWGKDNSSGQKSSITKEKIDETSQAPLETTKQETIGKGASSVESKSDSTDTPSNNITSPQENIDEKVPVSQADSAQIFASALIQQIPQYFARTSSMGAEQERKWRRAFNNAAYNTVITSLQPKVDSLFDAKATGSLLYLATSYLLSDSPDRCQSAITILERMAVESDGHRRSILVEANWSYILALICVDRTTEASALLRVIVNSSEHQHMNEAVKLLQFQNNKN